MNDNIFNFENGQLYLNLSIQLDRTYSSYSEALEALYSALDYSFFYRMEGRSEAVPHLSVEDYPAGMRKHEWHVLLLGDREAYEKGLRMHDVMIIAYCIVRITKRVGKWICTKLKVEPRSSSGI